NPKNLFCVGDPRQSIFGWRGSKIKYILEFNKKHKDSFVIDFNKNYRSSKKIVNLINESIKEMGLLNLEGIEIDDSNIFLLKFDREKEEYKFIIKKIKESKVNLEE